MPKQTVRLDGRKHSIPKCFESLSYKLETLVGIRNVGTGKFRARNYSGRNRIEIKYYDEHTPKMKITAYKRRFSQDFYLRVDPSEREFVEEQIREYRV